MRDKRTLHHPQTGATIRVFESAVPVHMASGWQPVEDTDTPPVEDTDTPAVEDTDTPAVEAQRSPVWMREQAEPTTTPPPARGKRRPFTHSEEPTDGDA